MLKNRNVPGKRTLKKWSKFWSGSGSAILILRSTWRSRRSSWRGIGSCASIRAIGSFGGQESHCEATLSVESLERLRSFAWGDPEIRSRSLITFSKSSNSLQILFLHAQIIQNKSAVAPRNITQFSFHLSKWAIKSARTRRNSQRITF